MSWYGSLPRPGAMLRLPVNPCSSPAEAAQFGLPARDVARPNLGLFFRVFPCSFVATLLLAVPRAATEGHGRTRKNRSDSGCQRSVVPQFLSNSLFSSAQSMKVTRGPSSLLRTHSHQPHSEAPTEPRFCQDLSNPEAPRPRRQRSPPVFVPSVPLGFCSSARAITGKRLKKIVFHSFYA